MRIRDPGTAVPPAAKPLETVEGLLDAVPAALAVLRGPDFILEAASAEWVRLMSRSGVRGQRIADVVCAFEQQRVGEALQQAFSRGETFQVREVAVPLLEDGREPTQRFFLDLTCRGTLDEEGRPRGVLLFAVDVTERVKNELGHKAERERLEAIFYGSASPMVFFRGPDLVYEMVNAKYEALVPRRELIGKPLLEALPELAGTPFPEIIGRVFHTGLPAVTHEELARLRNPATGELEDRYFDTAISRINDGEGKPGGVFVQATEVTERVESRKRIEEALATRDTFLSIASHELRTPLSAMMLQAQLIQRVLARGDGALAGIERLRKTVDQIDRGLGRMARLIEDMLDISRIQSGKLALNRELTDLSQLVTTVVDGFSDELAQAGVEVAVHAEPGDLSASIDRFRIEQVLTNLLTNVIKYAPRVPVSIQLRRADRFVELTLQDGGPGIEEKDRERIFERFERLVTPTQVGGLGLGLYIVRQIVDGHGGQIQVSGASGQGARFVLRLPGRSDSGLDTAVR